MLAVFPFFNGDLALLRGLLLWIKEIGQVESHDALLVADADTQWSDCVELVNIAGSAFRTVKLITNDHPVAGWIPGSVSLFRTAVQWCEENQRDFFWCEADCVPLVPEWLTELEKEYYEVGKQFLGAIIKAEDPRHPPFFLEGPAVYSKNAWSIMKDCIKDEESWVTSCANTVVPIAQNTLKIFQIWGQPGMPVRFVPFRTADSPSHDWTLDNIRKGAVLFHREKYGELITLLRERRLPSIPAKIVVVFPFCRNDVALALKHMEWLQVLGGSSNHDCVLLCPQDTNAAEMTRVARRTFKTVHVVVYGGHSNMGWPDGPNTAFRAAVGAMQKFNRPWLWLEADACVLRRDWLRVLEREYHHHQKPFFGPIVQGMGHMNGVGIYPPDTQKKLRRTLSLGTGTAWDSDMKDEMIHLCYDAGDIIAHCWGIIDGMPHPFQGADVNFPTQEHVDAWVLPSAVILHRCKNTSLLERLIERKR